MPSDPTVSLTPAQRRLLEQRLRARSPDGAGSPADGATQLSFGQERLWLLENLDPGVATYNQGYLHRLQGPLDVSACERALLEIARRHESLRTSIAVEDGVPTAMVRPVERFALAREDFTGLPEDARLAEAQRSAGVATLVPFDLGRDLLLRAVLYQLAEYDHVLLIVTHHMAWDAWSARVFWDELAALYADACAGRPFALPPPAARYADFAAHQRAHVQGATHARLLEFWRQQLETVTPLELPTDRPRPARSTHAGELLEFSWPAELHNALRQFAQAEGTTLFIVLLAGFDVLLHRLSGQEDIVVGTAVAGRQRREFEGLLGFFVNTLALRNNLAGDPTFRALLRRVHTGALAAFDHDAMPFEKLVAELHVRRDPVRHPVFQTMLVLHPAAVIPRLGELHVTPLPRPASRARFDFALTFVEQPTGELHGALEFSTELFDRATMGRWIAHLETLLRAALARTDAPISALPLLTRAQRAELLARAVGPRGDYPRDATVPEVFAAQAQRTPDAVALCTDAGSLSYAQLDARANQLAHHLIATGVQPGECVALELGRSSEFVITVLGILKAGAAYVPLTEEFPAARRAFILTDTAARVLIVANATAAPAPAGTMRVIDLNRDAAAIAAHPHTPPALAGRAEGAAYVMYTSGSTGRPKGVVISHRGIVRLVCGDSPSRFTADSCFLLLASPAFDASTFELWAPLLNGACLAIMTEARPDLAELERVVRARGVSHLFLTAAWFNLVVEQRPEALRGLRHVFTGGEAMSMPHARRLRVARPDLALTNCYGPTEVTVYATTYDVTEDTAWPHGSVPIGRPAAQTRCYILGAAGEPAPLGVPGELFVGGDGLARGYLGLPEVTAERFVPDPFADQPDARMYRTGDRCRWLAEGTIEFLGRFDDQLKLRGFRIEPGEIEAALLQHPTVRAAVVIVREDQPGQRRLVGYVVPRDPARALTDTELREFLGARLPAYLIPARFVALERFPLTTSDKIDRRALPAPETASDTPDDAPANATEQIVAEVWRSVLGADLPTRHADFFALGGHSLLAMRAAALLATRTGRTVPLRWWFDHPTVAGLAARLATAASEEPAQAIPLVPRDRELPLSHEEQRLWFLHHALPNAATYNVCWCARVRGTIDVSRLRGALHVVMRRHEILRTAFTDRRGSPVRVIANEADVPPPLFVEVHPATGNAVDDVTLSRRIITETRRPFDLAAPPLFRVTCLQLRPDDQLLIFAAHHIICDEWSLQILHDELAAEWNAQPLPTLPVQYADYAAWQLERVAGSGFDPHREFWRRTLQGAPLATELPGDRLRPTAATGLGRRLFFSLPRAAGDALENFGRAMGATPFMVWLAAYGAWLARWTNQSDLVIGTPLAHRQRPEVQPLMGFFLNTLPVRLRLPGSAGFRTCLALTREAVLAAFEHGELPLDAIAAAQSGPRQTAGAALFNVMFVVPDELRAVWDLPGTTVETLGSETGTAKTDLTLFINRHAPEGLRGSFEFNTDVFDTATVVGLVSEFEQLLVVAAADPDASLFTSASPFAPPPTLTAPVSRTPTAASGEMEKRLLPVWQRVLQRDVIGVHDDFFSIGGHSLLAMQLTQAIQDTFDRRVPLAQLLAHPTLAQQAVLLAEPFPLAAAPVAPAWRGAGAGVPFFFIPGLGGVEFMPSVVATRLGRERRCFDALQHRGADGHEPPCEQVEEIAADLIVQIRRVQPQGPYSIGGFCHGGLIGYEVARQLTAAGETVSGLVLWDTFPRARWRRRSLAGIVAQLRQRLGPGAGPDRRRFVADRAHFLWHQLKTAAGWLGRAVGRRVPVDGVTRDVRDQTNAPARIVAAGYRARARYLPGRYDGRVLLVRSRLERVFREPLPLDGWDGILQQPPEIHDLPHSHFDLLQPPAVDQLAEKTAAFLRATDPER